MLAVIDGCQICSGCGCLPEIKKELNYRIHYCVNCGLKLDTAAINVLKLGLEQTFVERKPILVCNIETSKFISMKQEAHDFSHG